VSEANRYADATSESDDRSRAWYGIARALASNGEDPKPALANIDAPRWRSDALAQVGRIFAKRGQQKLAESNFSQARELARTHPTDRTRLIGRLVQARAAVGDSAKARELLADLPEGKERFKALLALLTVDIEAGRFAAAQQLGESLEDAERDEVNRYIAIGLAEQGETRRALHLARSIVNDQQRVKALRRIAELEASRNDQFGLLSGEYDALAEAPDSTVANAMPPGRTVGLSTQINLQPLASSALGQRLPTLPSMTAEVATVRQQVPAIAPGKAHEALMIYNQYNRKFFLNTEQEGGGRRLAMRQGVVSPRYIYLENGVFNLAAIARALQVSSAEDAVLRDGEIVTVRLPILIGPDASLVISGNELAELRLSATRGAFIANAGKLYVVDTRVVGYDEEQGDIAWHTYKDRDTFRPFILSWSSSDTQLAGSSFIALGYTSSKAYGISLSSGPTELIRGSQKAKRPTGVIVENSFDNVHYGFYSYEADYVKLVGNEYRNNIVYGIDPHDRSRYLVIAYNTAYDTHKKHGIIISREVDHSFIVGNVSFDNVGSGFMLDRDCIETLVYANTAFDNQQDGIAVFESSCNLLASNHLFGNRRAGIKIRNSWDVGVFRNRMTNNQGAALEGYIARLEDAASDVPRDFALDPYTPLTTFSAADNLMRSNDSGIIGKGVTAMTLVSNRFVDQSTKLFGGDLRPHTLDLLPFSHLARDGALVMSACRQPPPPVECAWRTEQEQQWLNGDGQDGLFATAENVPACDQVPGTLEAQALMNTAELQKTQVE
jgi:poly(beta-D-mannuronate) C5 epimerase